MDYWETLQKSDTLFGNIAGILLLIGGAQWIIRRTAQSNQTTNMLAWAIFGEENGDALHAASSKVGRLILAAFVWAIIGAIIAVSFIILLTLVAILLGTEVSGVRESLPFYAFLGAFIGIVMRLLVLPTVDYISDALKWRSKSHEEATKLHQDRRKKNVSGDNGKT